MADMSHASSGFTTQDPYAAIVDMLDRAMLSLYAGVRRNSRRIVRFVVVLLPLMLLLVGSCKTSTPETAAYQPLAAEDRFRTALFPDRVNFTGMSYYPAEGYIARARSYVSDDPETLSMLTEQEITYLFGKPTMARKDAQASVWQYKTGTCVVDFYFYDQPGLEDESRVSFVDVRRIGKDGRMQFKTVSEARKSDCFETVIDEGDFSRDDIASAFSVRI